MLCCAPERGAPGSPAASGRPGRRVQFPCLAHAHTRPHTRVRTDPKDRHTHPEGLPEVLAPIVADGTAPTNYEDLVEILGEIADHERDAEAVTAIVRLLADRLPSDGPSYGLSLKAVQALGAIGGAEAEQALRAVAEGADHPKPVRWEAT